ncbi:hypothetical protein [Maribacter spongiicola]|uniref:hypothetical protein n=1 Tax=Maribacter spongiicola TaxID=1206753 RepID=UPI003F9BDB57
MQRGNAKVIYIIDVLVGTFNAISKVFTSYISTTSYSNLSSVHDVKSSAPNV